MWYRRYGGYGRGYQPSKTATAASLSANTLQRIIDQQRAAEAASAARSVEYARMQAETQKRLAEEKRLEEEHGGKENLAKWRAENKERLEREAREKREREIAAAKEKKQVDELAELTAELSALGPQGSSRILRLEDLSLNKSNIKAQFQLTDKDLEALPKNVVMKEGGKRASSITWSGKDIAQATISKLGARAFRAKLSVSYPAIAHAYLTDQIAILRGSNPGLAEKARAAALEKLRSADASASSEVARLEEALAKARAALESGRAKQARAREALEAFATHDELCALDLPPLGANNAEAGSSVYSSTPFTAPGAPPAKKQKLTGGKAPIPAFAPEVCD